jgi:hypothetical protein
MRLILTLEETGQVWTLDDSKDHSVDSGRECDISLPKYKKSINRKHLNFSFITDENQWRVDVLPGEKSTRINENIVASSDIREKTKIILGAGILINATPATTSSETRGGNQAKPEVSSRLISGSAYLRGLVHSLKLLEFLRADPYKTNSPETALDLDEISTHVSQAIFLYLLCACIGVLVLFIQLSVGIVSDWRLLGGIELWRETFPYSNWWSFFAGFRSLNGGKEFIALFTFLDFCAAFAIAYELTFMRWAIARKFLKKEKYRRNIRTDFHIRIVQSLFFKKLVSILKNRTRKMDPFQNVITFGGFNPFLGAGESIKNSDITIVIDRQKVSDTFQDRRSVEILESEFYNAIDQEVSKLNLPNLETLSQLHVKGFELEQDDVILYGRLTKPISTLPQEELWSIGQRNLENDKRAYRVYRYIDETRDNVLSYFIRFYNAGSITFLEANAYGLTSFDRKHYSLSSVLKDNLVMKIGEFFLVFLVLSQFRIYLIVALYQIVRFLYSVIRWYRQELQAKRSARLHEEYNYGLTRTFRESVAAPFDSSYYGNQDLIMYWRAIQQAIFKGVLDVLKKHDLNTSQFETSIRAITNYGVMVTGGSLNASQVAVGQNASVSVNRPSGSGSGSGFVGSIISGLNSVSKTNNM